MKKLVFIFLVFPLFLKAQSNIEKIKSDYVEIHTTSIEMISNVQF